MKASQERLAILFREAGLIDDAHWVKHLRAMGAGKGIGQALLQDVSVSAFKDLLFAEIRLPFSRAGGKGLHQALTTQIRPTAGELLALIKKFRPPVDHLTRPFIEAGLVRASDVDAAVKTHEPGEANRYDQLFRQNVLTAELIPRFFAEADRRRHWPYHQRLILDILRVNQLVDQNEYESLAGDEGADLALRLKGRKWPQGSLLDAAQGGLDLPEADLESADIDPEIAAAIPRSLALRHRALPLNVGPDGALRVAMSDPLNTALGDLLWLMTGKPIEGLYAPEEAIAARAESMCADTASTVFGGAQSQPAAPDRSTEATSTVNLVSSIIEGAIDLDATDIHLEPAVDGDMRVRYRIDGRLRNIVEIPREHTAAVVSRIKVLGNLNVTERRRPQDGHFDLKADSTNFDFRISTLPCKLGEKIVIRILDESTVKHGLAELGLMDDQRSTLEDLCRRPHGMILVTGPTGSGKTSTLYSCLSLINSLETNITTIEDPVEYQLPGVNQVGVNPEIHMGFAQGLRAILRQDPDVIMVGEIRDAETAAIAIRAAMTGHLVFSTLHTNTALGAYVTLNHMGVHMYMVAEAVLALVAQRLARRVCDSCRAPHVPEEALIRKAWPKGGAPERFFQGRGCEACLNSGYKGRIGLFEVVESSARLRNLAARGAPEAELQEQARIDGYVSLMDVGRRMIEAGVTSLEEVMCQTLAMERV